ncbi:carbon storage regulator CsrA [Sporosarcina psychrophila]|uniref:carbon storage regulator CsrA n=1 Tax=Sporosarcina psychrophila TaxID=1476 RepID=UPI00078BC877|nr:carbon storage regulator CsrA [Sporosarcina psychrophila]AMQ07539.1 carbon storage regulator [Sporosarcina psychrophila]
MLVLSRKKGESIWLGDQIEITISEIKGDQVRIAINAPKNVTILRGELRQEVSESNTEAVKIDGFMDYLKNEKK